MHNYFEKLVEVRQAERDFKSSIERIANKCNIDINIMVFTGIPLVIVWDEYATVRIDAISVSELIPISPYMPTGKDWSIFLTKLRQLVKYS